MFFKSKLKLRDFNCNELKHEINKRQLEFDQEHQKKVDEKSYEANLLIDQLTKYIWHTDDENCIKSNKYKPRHPSNWLECPGCQLDYLRANHMTYIARTIEKKRC